MCGYTFAFGLTANRNNQPKLKHNIMTTLEIKGD